MLLRKVRHYFIDDNNVKCVNMSLLESSVWMKAYCTSIPVLDQLLKWGYEIDFQDRAGETMLFHAVCSQYPQSVRFLLNRGADPSLHNNKNMSPCEWAWREFHWGYYPYAIRRNVLFALLSAGCVFVPDTWDQHPHRKHERFDVMHRFSIVMLCVPLYIPRFKQEKWLKKDGIRSVSQFLWS